MLQTRPDSYPEYHFLLVAPNLGAEWLFDAARAYWDRYRPTIITNLDFVQLIPPDRSIVVTVIALRDTASQLGARLAQINGNAYFDAVVYELFEQTKAALEERVRLGQPFGVPLNLPTATTNPNAPFVPTPRLPPTNPPAGFVTQPPATPPALPTAHPNATEPMPSSPTPGSVLGG